MRAGSGPAWGIDPIKAANSVFELIGVIIVANSTLLFLVYQTDIHRESMSFRIDLDPSLSIVNVAYNGAVSLDMRKRAVEQVCGDYAELKPLKILVDVRDLIMDLTLDEQQAFGEYLANHPGLNDARVAVLHSTDFNPNVVIDTCAYNNGYLLAQFASRADAEMWLSNEI